MPVPDKDTTDRFRAYNLGQMQAKNVEAADSLAHRSLLGPFWVKLSGHGPILATEMTNRLANYGNLHNLQMHCDARRWITDIFVPSTQEYKLIVRYNATKSSIQRREGIKESDQHFFNLMFMPKVGSEIQLAHITIFTRVDRVDDRRGPMSYTPLGFIHLKDDLAIGRLKADQSGLDSSFPSEHGIFKPAKHHKPAKVDQSIRRFFIQTEVRAAVPSKPANPAHPFGTSAIPAKTVYRIGLQNQIGNVSTMAIRFSQVVFQVLQKYFDDGFNVAVFNTPANPQSFKADPMCKAPANAAYNSLTNIGKKTDIADLGPVGRVGPTATEAERLAAAARLAALRALPVIGGRKKTRRSKQSRRKTRKNNA